MSTPPPRKQRGRVPVMVAGPNEKATVKMPAMTVGDKLTIEFSDPDKVAAFFELCAQLVRERRKISVTVE